MKPGGLKLSLDEGQSTSALTLEEKIFEFKSDPDKLAEATKFVDGVIRQAEVEAGKRALQTKQDSTKIGVQGRRQSESKVAQRVVTRARGVVVRWFENICNCTHTAINKRAFFKIRNNSAPPASSTTSQQGNKGNNGSSQK